MATTDANGFITIENSDLFNISHANGNAAAASAVANRVTTAEGNISDIQTALGNKVDTSTYTAGMATKVNSSTYTSGMATKVDKVTGKGLSTEDYTTAEKNKLAGIETGANAYSLPKAAAGTLGGIKVGNNLSIDNDGVLSATDMHYTLPTADASTKGGIKVGKGLSISDAALSLKVTHTTAPFSSVKKNESETSAKGDAWFWGEGTEESPALCVLRASPSILGLTTADTLTFTLNGFHAHKNNSPAPALNGAISGNIFTDVGDVIGYYHVHQAHYPGVVDTITAKFTADSASQVFTAIFPAIFD